MNKGAIANKRDSGGIFSRDQFLTLYFPAFVFALGASIATPAIPSIREIFRDWFCRCFPCDRHACLWRIGRGSALRLFHRSFWPAGDLLSPLRC